MTGFRLFAFVTTFFVAFQMSLAQSKTLSRQYVPIIMKGYQMPVERMRKDEWYAFRYDAVLGNWTAVPFQVDEVDDEGKYNKETDGTIDTNDELLVMPKDLGDRAVHAEWPEQVTDRQSQRIEIRCTDPVDHGVGWLYLYQNVSGETPAQGYLGYAPAPDASAADTAKSLAYRIGHNPDGWIDYISLSSNFRADLVDRLKLRLAGETAFGGIGRYVFTEDTLNEGSSTFHPGLIRAFHDQRTLLSVPQLWPQPFHVDYQLQYFPYSFRIGVSGAQLDSPLLLAAAGLKAMRQSLDLSQAARGMRFYSENNLSGVLIDGVPDEVEKILNQDVGSHWVMASGEPGTIMMILQLPEIPGSSTQLYYLDQEGGAPLDGTPDTGDGSSFGDMGLWVSGEVLATTRITMDFTIYLLDQTAANADLAQELFAWHQNPVSIEAVAQSYQETGVFTSSTSPEQFELEPAYPNPISPTQKSVTFGLTLRTSRSVIFEIYNTLGQKIYSKLIVGVAGQHHEVTWDKRDFANRAVPSGIYFYRLLSGRNSVIQKLIIL